MLLHILIHAKARLLKYRYWFISLSYYVNHLRNFQGSLYDVFIYENQMMGMSSL